MKKMILLLVSGLLIACMAGSAMAMGLDILGPSSNSASIKGQTITISPTSPFDIYLEVVTDPTESGWTDFPVTIKRLDPNPPHSVINAPINIFATPNKFTLNLLPSNTAVSGSKVALGVGSQATAGELYRVAVGSQEFEVSVTTIVRTVPEFPTVALPVAGVLGLLFVFGRKKEGL